MDDPIARPRGQASRGHPSIYYQGLDRREARTEGLLASTMAIFPETSNTVEGGEEGGIIGEVRDEPERMVLMHTRFGGARMIDMLVGDPLPRIC